MADDLRWVPTAMRKPHNLERVYARAKGRIPQKVTFYANPPQWVSARIVYQFEHFTEWAPAEAEDRALDKTGNYPNGAD